VEHRAAWDATFSAPKSVSLTALVGEDSRILEAHNRAVDVALSRLEKYTQARVASDQSVTTGKFVAAKFEHHTARPVDGYSAPQLHTHVVIFNMTQRADGTWNSLQPKALYESQQYATAIYQSELTYQLKQLGFELEAGKSGAPEIRGYSQEYLDASSLRRQQITDYLDKHGLRGPQAAEFAAHNTRDSKQVMGQDEILAAHKQLAEEYGNQPARVIKEAADNLSNKISEIAQSIDDEPSQAKQSVTYATKRNFERESVVDERMLIRDALRRGMGSTRITAVEEELASRMSTGQLLTVSREHTTNNPTRFMTAPDVVASEKYVIREMQNGKNSINPIMSDKSATAQSQKHESLNQSQQQVFKDVLTTRDRIHGLQGIAGTGKTTVLKAIREGAERSGFVVQGFAPTSRAAQELRDANISADTIQGFLAKGGQENDSKYLYMLDESSLASTVQMREFLKKLGPDDRVLLIGDIRQHQGVEAGKPFEQLQQAGMTTSVLDQIVRQKDAELRQAVEHLSRNETSIGVQLLQQQGRIQQVEDPDQRVNAIADRYVQNTKDTIVVSPDNASRREINLAIRERLQNSGVVAQENHSMKVLVNRSDLTGADRAWAARYSVGEFVQYQKGSQKFNLEANSFAQVTGVNAGSNTLTVKKSNGETVTYNPEYLKGVSVHRELDRDFAVGDRLQFTARNKELGISNRDIGTIESIGPGAREIALKMDNGKSVRFDPQQIRTFDHGYAVTSHSSQGLTAERVIVNMDLNTHKDLINTRFAYVSISRAKVDAQIFTNDVSRLAERLSHDVTKESALDAIKFRKETQHQQEPIENTIDNEEAIKSDIDQKNAGKAHHEDLSIDDSETEFEMEIE
jgi:conjugative relaxase-like TrwC/TraI family protein